MPHLSDWISQQFALITSNYSEMVKNCVEKNPKARQCYYWICKGNNYLKLTEGNIDEEEDDENKDIMNQEDWGTVQKQDSAITAEGINAAWTFVGEIGCF